MFTRRSWSPSRAPASAHSPLAQDQAAALDAEAAPGGAALPRTMGRSAGAAAAAVAGRVAQRARRRRRVARWLIAGVVLLAVTAVLVVEARTSRLQAKLFASFDTDPVRGRAETESRDVVPRQQPL